MKIVLAKDYPTLGFTGDIVTVKRGYARNFLLPRGVAIEAASRNAKVLQHKISGITAKKARLKKEAEGIAAELSKNPMAFTLKIGKVGKSFGSVSVKDVLDTLKNKGFEFDRKQIVIPESIKAGGSYKILVKLHAEVTATLTANVIVERAAKENSNTDAQNDEIDAAAGMEGKKRGGRKPRKSAENTEEVA